MVIPWFEKWRRSKESHPVEYLRKEYGMIVFQIILLLLLVWEDKTDSYVLGQCLLS